MSVAATTSRDERYHADMCGDDMPRSDSMAHENSECSPS